ncbi:hypothetical protein ABH37_06185 [Mycobacterium haemophilum]|uniref:Arabinosyltransferase n=1 Tax=Mycobacterium haemophilum TaxID=29311 RepID=A0A0I9XNI4_9MYCO|nr:hypothetical protein ABH39_14200 [Mycobacterium haemophilum]KLO37517.1 hypothetical protein ABH38_08660 [Mycobacterium haemophilum]KLO44064.1 hypothetical protein ABH37_06185 [Mycobacterium haemophilum]KLO49332.1 hypothetical protein ABH36_13050 [Mycobacterium haemophilum]
MIGQVALTKKISSPIARVVMIIFGLVGVFCAVAVPLLPVNQTQTRLVWPIAGKSEEIIAPLVSYSPTRIVVSVSRAALDVVQSAGGTVVATVPESSTSADAYGLVVRVTARSGSLPIAAVVLRNQMVMSIPVADVPVGSDITISSDPTMTTVSASNRRITLKGDHRPQLVGIFSDLRGPAPPGLYVDAKLDSRFTTRPTVAKTFAAFAAALATLIAVTTLRRAEARRTKKAVFRPQRSVRRHFRLSDAVVVISLLFWYLVGATTQDDGYYLIIAREAMHAGYPANYYRFWSAPETPFGALYYDLIGWLAGLTPSVPVIRLPGLACGIACWLLVSRKVIPRLGAVAGSSRTAYWTAAAVFLSFWLPYDNGVRPEPPVAVGVLLTWCLVEQAIATRRLHPFAVGLATAGLTVATATSGIICIPILLCGIREIVHIFRSQARVLGWSACLAPSAAAAAVALAVAFAETTFAVVPAVEAAHRVAGPDVSWFGELQRYQRLLDGADPSGSLALRFPVLMILFTLIMAAIAIYRPTKYVGLAIYPSRRIVLATFSAIVELMFLPTKWTHHFGALAGLASSVAVVAIIAIGSRVSAHPSRTVTAVAGALAFILALTFAGPNSWYYVSNYGIPWSASPVSVGGIKLSNVMLAASISMLAILVWLHIHVEVSRRPAQEQRFKQSRCWPRGMSMLGITATAMVAFEMASFTTAAVARYPAFSVARSNFDALAGKPCALADDVMVEPDVNQGMLQPRSSDALTALGAGGVEGFTPTGVPVGTVSAYTSPPYRTTASTVVDASSSMDVTRWTTDGNGRRGTNDSNIALPFGLDPATTPVLGSYNTNVVGVKSLVSGWYRLPVLDTMDKDEGIISLAVAGIIDPQRGSIVKLELGAASASTVTLVGEVVPADVGMAPSWRNLRVPLKLLPSNTNVARIRAIVSSQDPNLWLALTPPRVPRLRSLNETIGDQPVLLDWVVAAQFPCQRPFGHRGGVAELPRYRILPGQIEANWSNLWQGHFGGGPLGWAELLFKGAVIPSYLRNDWDCDWGQIQRLVPLKPEAQPAQLKESTVRRSGLWSPGPLPVTFPDDTPDPFKRS